MNKFLYKSFLFLLPVCILAGYFEYKLTLMPNSYNKKRTNLESQLDSIEVLVLGNSRSLYSINPAYFNAKSYNLSHVSQTFFYTSELGLRYIPKMPKLRCVVIESLPTSFGINLTKTIERWRAFYYLHFWDIDNADLPWYEVKRYSKIFLYEPKRVLYYAFHGFKVALANGVTRNGWEFMDTTNTKSFINDSIGKTRVAFNESFYREDYFEQNIEHVTRLVAAVAARNIPCVLLTSPVYRTFSKYMSRTKHQKGLKILNELCVKYGCVYYNYLTDPRFDVNDFADNDHFNFIGARKYSRILNDEVIRKYVRNESPPLNHPAVHPSEIHRNFAE